MGHFRTAAIVLGATVLLFIVSDNVYYEATREARSENVIHVRHAAGIDDIHLPPASYVAISEPSLPVTAVRFRTDALGSVLPHGGAGPCRIFFVGGSTTEAHWMQETERWPYLVGESALIRDAVTTYNFGVGGYNLHQNLVKYLAVLNREMPDVVVVMHAVNEVAKFLNGGYYALEDEALHNSYDIEMTPRLRRRLREILERTLPTASGAWRTLRNRGLEGSRGSTADADDDTRGNASLPASAFAFDLVQLEARLTALHALVRANGGTLVVLTQPDRARALLNDATRDSPAKRYLATLLASKSLSPVEYVERIEAVDTTLRAVAQREAIPLIDLKSLFPASDTAMYDSIHYTPAGSALVADIVATALRPVVTQACARPASR